MNRNGALAQDAAREWARRRQEEAKTRENSRSCANSQALLGNTQPRADNGRRPRADSQARAEPQPRPDIRTDGTCGEAKNRENPRPRANSQARLDNPQLRPPQNPQPRFPQNPQPRPPQNPQARLDNQLRSPQNPQFRSPQPRADNPQPRPPQNPQFRSPQNPQPRLENQPRPPQNPQPRPVTPEEVKNRENSRLHANSQALLENPQPRAENPQARPNNSQVLILRPRANSQLRAENPRPRADNSQALLEHPQPRADNSQALIENSRPRANSQARAENPQPRPVTPEAKNRENPRPRANSQARRDNPQLRPPQNPQPRFPQNPQLRADNPPQNPQARPPQNPQANQLRSPQNPQPRSPQNPQLRSDNPQARPPQNPQARPPQNPQLRLENQPRSPQNPQLRADNPQARLENQPRPPQNPQLHPPQNPQPRPDNPQPRPVTPVDSGASPVVTNNMGTRGRRSGRPAPTSLPRIPEGELKIVETLGEGSVSLVRRATWTRVIPVGNREQIVNVAVKISNKLPESNASQLLSADLARDLEVMSNLPHQNIVIFHGVCEPTGGTPMIVYELMSTDLAKEIARLRKSKQRPLFPMHTLLQILRDVSSGLAHLHWHGVVHRDVKPANVLLRGDLVKLCDFGSSKDLTRTIAEMTVAGTLDYMAPEIINRQRSGFPADVWSFGVLLFECVTGYVCARGKSILQLKAELKQADCLPQLIQLFGECHQAQPKQRPSMADVNLRLQSLAIEYVDSVQRLEHELKRAEAQDKDLYDSVWQEYATQPGCEELLAFLARQRQSPELELGVVQPINRNSLEDLKQLASQQVCERLHGRLGALVVGCGGKYERGSRKADERCVDKVDRECGGDYGKLLDLERGMGIFKRPEDMQRCLQRLQQGAATGVSLVRCKDRLNKPLSGGYRDLLLNVCDVESGFVAELQLNFPKIAQIKSRAHFLYELQRVKKLR